jgi:site-specific DNA recombinase
VNVLSGAPYGYVYIRKRDTQQARYEIHPHEAPVVRRVFELYTRQFKSIGAIARQLTEDQIPSRTRKGHWDRSVICDMLKNPAYIGKAAFRKTRQVQRKKMTKQSRDRGGYPKRALSSHADRPQEEWIFIPVPAIIDEGTFNKAREQLQENKKLSARNNTKHPYLLSGLLSCQRCGYSLYGKPASNSRYKRCYYRCMGQDGYRWPNGRVCDAHPVRVEVLDELVWQNVQQLIQHPQLVLHEYSQRLGSKEKQQLSLEHLLNKKHQELRHHDQQKQRLLDLYQAGSISLEEIQGRLDQIRADMQHIRQEWKLLQDDQTQQLKQLQLIEQFDTFTQKLDTNLNNLEFAQKKRLVRLLVKEVIVDAVTEEIIIRHTLPLDNTTPPDYSGGSGPSDVHGLQDEHSGRGLKFSQNTENTRGFDEALQESFPLCRWGNYSPLRRSRICLMVFPVFYISSF